MLFDKKILLLVALFYAQGESQYVPKLRSLASDHRFNDMHFYKSSSPDIFTENESIMYAACNNQDTTFKKNFCHVIVDTPLFQNASYEDICNVNIEPNNPNIESLTKLTIRPFGDDKALLSWTVKDIDWHTKSLQIRILHFSNCRYKDVSVLADKLHTIVPYENSFDVVVRGFNKAMCGSDHCKVTYNTEGEKTNGPSQFLAGVKFAQLEVLIPAVARSPLKGFYALLQTVNKTDNAVVMHAGNDGKSSELLKIGKADSIHLSGSYEHLGVCWTTEYTNVTCKQYDAKMNLKFTTVSEFIFDQYLPNKRWIKPHNLMGGGMVLATGIAIDQDRRQFRDFQLFKIQANGHRERQLIINTDYKIMCLNNAEFRVVVSENDNDELCVHFHCEKSYDDRGEDIPTLQVRTHCIPKKYVSMPKRQPSVLN